MNMPATEPAVRDVPPTVYVVEDDEAVRDSFAAMLDACGMNVRGFASAEEYLAARATAPDGCLLLDLNLPGMNGLELLEHLLSQGVSIPTVIVTARRDARIDQRASMAGAVAVFDKPVDRQALLDAVRAALGSGKAH